jgi:hypothetical protein
MSGYDESDAIVFKSRSYGGTVGQDVWYSQGHLGATGHPAIDPPSSKARGKPANGIF